MLNKFFAIRPTTLFVAAVAVFLGVLISRETFEKEALPVFLSLEQKKIYVELTFGDSWGGVYQINDGLTLCGVINLTGALSKKSFPECHISLVNGEQVVLREKGHIIEIVERGWMAAGQRMALSIPLHPDRMSQKDWTALPGIGEKLAQKIEADRQTNGEFGSISQLIRVKGIGPKRVENWKVFFSGT